MAEDKKPGVTIEAPAPEEQRPEPPAPETPDAPTPPGPEVLTVEEQLILEHEGQAALLKQGGRYQSSTPFKATVCGGRPKRGTLGTSWGALENQQTLFPP